MLKRFDKVTLMQDMPVYDLKNGDTGVVQATYEHGMSCDVLFDRGDDTCVMAYTIVSDVLVKVLPDICR